MNDALVVALILPTSSERRQLVVAFYDGSDRISIISPTKLQTVAARTEAILHIQLFQVTVPTIVRGVLGPFPFHLNGLSDPDKERIIKVAETTGGGAWGTGLFGRMSMMEFFTNVLTDLPAELSAAVHGQRCRARRVARD